MSRHLITSALPYINGVKHLGNLIGSILPADVFARHLRQCGEEVLYICGTDEHGTPAELAAQAQGQTIEEYCAHMHATQREIYKRFSISFDHFGRSSSPENHEITQSIFKTLEANGYIEKRLIKQVYSNTEQRFLPDRYVIGTCPHCAYEKARGDQCESCGRLLDTIDLINPHSALSNSTDLEIRSSEHLFLKLGRLTSRLKQWVEQHDQWSTVTKGVAKKWLQEGLKERCITRDLEWGVKIPKEGFNGKVFYVWFDAPIAYISISQEWAKHQNDASAWKNWWYDAGEKTRYYQFMAKDNLPFHTIFWPAVMMGTEQPWKLPDDIKGFNWLTYESGKFSTSDQRGIFTDTALTLFPADYWRYYLLANAPESSDADFNFPHFAQVINKDLSDTLGNFVNRVHALIKKYFNGLVPEYIKLPAEHPLVRQCSNHLRLISEALTQMKFRQATQALRQFWVFGNEYISEEQPWKLIKTDEAAAAQILVNCLHFIYYFSVASTAFIPDTAQRLFNVINIKQSPDTVDINGVPTFNILKLNDPIHLDENLFQKIDETEVEQLRVRFSGDAQTPLEKRAC